MMYVARNMVATKAGKNPRAVRLGRENLLRNHGTKRCIKLKSFAGVGEDTVKKINALAAEFNYKPNEPPFSPRTYPPSDQFSFRAVECQKLEATVKFPVKSPGIDKIPIRVIKDSLPAILPSITSIINTSQLTSSFPNVWKIAQVTPILQSGDHETPNNNRPPISLLPVLSKVCERVVHDQLTDYLLSRNRLNKVETKHCTQPKPRLVKLPTWYWARSIRRNWQQSSCSTWLRPSIA